jgi:hypothetical protein
MSSSILGQLISVKLDQWPLLLLMPEKQNNLSKYDKINKSKEFELIIIKTHV